MIYLLGMGGSREGILLHRELLRRADRLIGSRRLISELPADCCPDRVVCTDPEKTVQLLRENKEGDTCVLFSGDTGFYSGCARLAELLSRENIPFTIVPGISSVALLAARARMPWQDWNLVSAHGREILAVNAVMKGRWTCFLTGGRNTPGALCEEFRRAGLGDLEVMVGERLSAPDECIRRGTASEFAGRPFDPLSVMLVQPAPRYPYRCPGIEDAAFVRGDVPMTKQFVRCGILAAMQPRNDALIWDVGAGTGSVSTELALCAADGLVYAVEEREEGLALIRANRERFHAYNLTLVPGRAPEALKDLPDPDCVFIGGSGGELTAIIREALSRSGCRVICVSSVSVETTMTAVSVLEEEGLDVTLTQIGVSTGRKAGNLHMFSAQNPVCLIRGCRP